MPEPPDFDQIAERLVDRIWSAAAERPGIAAPSAVVEALREIWNARGAADVAAIEALKSGPNIAWLHVPVDNLKAVLKSIDR